MTKNNKNNDFIDLQKKYDDFLLIEKQELQNFIKNENVENKSSKERGKAYEEHIRNKLLDLKFNSVNMFSNQKNAKEFIYSYNIEGIVRNNDTNENKNKKEDEKKNGIERDFCIQIGTKQFPVEVKSILLNPQKIQENIKKNDFNYSMACFIKELKNDQNDLKLEEKLFKQMMKNYTANSKGDVTQSLLDLYFRRLNEANKQLYTIYRIFEITKYFPNEFNLNLSFPGIILLPNQPTKKIVNSYISTGAGLCLGIAEFFSLIRLFLYINDYENYNFHSYTLFIMNEFFITAAFNNMDSNQKNYIHYNKNYTMNINSFEWGKNKIENLNQYYVKTNASNKDFYNKLFQNELLYQKKIEFKYSKENNQLINSKDITDSLYLLDTLSYETKKHVFYNNKEIAEFFETYYMDKNVFESTLTSFENSEDKLKKDIFNRKRKIENSDFIIYQIPQTLIETLIYTELEK